MTTLPPQLHPMTILKREIWRGRNGWEERGGEGRGGERRGKERGGERRGEERRGGGGRGRGRGKDWGEEYRGNKRMRRAMRAIPRQWGRQQGGGGGGGLCFVFFPFLRLCTCPVSCVSQRHLVMGIHFCKKELKRGEGGKGDGRRVSRGERGEGGKTYQHSSKNEGWWLLRCWRRRWADGMWCSGSDVHHCLVHKLPISTSHQVQACLVQLFSCYLHPPDFLPFLLHFSFCWMDTVQLCRQRPPRCLNCLVVVHTFLLTYLPHCVCIS